MKTLIITIILLVFSFMAFPQEGPPDTIFHFTSQNKLYIFDRFEYNCCCGFVVNIEHGSGFINLYAVDTLVNEACYCVCTFEILTEIDSIGFGSYMVHYYRVDKDIDTTLMYAFNFVQANSTLPASMNYHFTAGICNQQILKAYNPYAQENHLAVFPNPACNSAWISLSKPEIAEEIILTDITGRTLAEMHNIKLPYNLLLEKFEKGIVFIKVANHQKLYFAKLVIK